MARAFAKSAVAPSLPGLPRVAPDEVYAAAIKAGGTDEGEPADRSYFAPGYYAANIADFDVNRLEFVHNAWNPKQH